MPRFSVIVPVWNKGAHLRGVIDSVLKQTWTDFELILVDDASTDRSLEIIQSYDDCRLRVFKRAEPGPGGYAARNHGIRMARGEWVAFLDADDKWNPDHLERKNSLILEFPEGHVFSCRWMEETERSNWVPKGFEGDTNGQSLTGNDYVDLCLNGKRPINSNVITVRRDWLLERGLWFPAGKTDRTGDVGLWLQIVLAANGVVAGSFFGAQRMVSTENRVSRMSEPNPHYFVELKNKIISNLSDAYDQRLVEKYLDTLIAYALKEARRTGPGALFVMDKLRTAPNGVFLKALISQSLPPYFSMALTNIHRRLMRLWA